MNIYTRKGDAGETMTAAGKRVLKCDFNIEAVGEVDELNAVLGMVKIKNIDKIQEDLFVVGSLISGGAKLEAGNLKLEKRVTFFEKEMDRMWKEMTELKNFIIFGGTETASLLFFARAVCRRAERAIVGLLCPAIMPRRRSAPAGPQPYYKTIIKYLNRLSDYLFCLGRWENFKAGVGEKTWKA